MSDLLKTWESAKSASADARDWNDKPTSKHKYSNSKFAISKAHCKAPKLMRCGQHTCGGTNYWDSPERLNDAVLTWIVDNWDTVYAGAQVVLDGKESDALNECQSFVDEMQAKIDANNKQPNGESNVKNN